MIEKQYVKIDGVDANESQLRANQINSLLFNMQMTDGTPEEEAASRKIFGEFNSWTTGYCALQIELEYPIIIRNIEQASMLLEGLKSVAPEEELNEIMGFIEMTLGQPITFEDILPPSEPIFNFSDLEAEGWWAPPEED